MTSFTVRPSDDCPSGIATAVRMVPSARVHNLMANAHPEMEWVGKMPACGSSMGNTSARIVLTSDMVTCPRCLRGETL